jgi:tRNA threonylcarbamoyladenosine biosynthesis protein TsaB
MRLLALDTSTPAACAAVVELAGGAARALDQRDSRVTTHSEGMLVLIDAVLGGAGVKLADLAGLAVGAGPGSFTGLRIGMATAKGLCFAAGLPLWPVSSLAALALDAGAAPGAFVVPILDAKRDEIYAGFYRIDAAGLPVATAPERVLAPARLAAHTAGQDALLCGTGALAYPAALAGAGRIAFEARATPSALAVARLALALRPDDALVRGAPAYLRASEAELKLREK